MVPYSWSDDVQTPPGKVLKDFLLTFVMFVVKTKYFKRRVLTKTNS